MPLPNMPNVATFLSEMLERDYEQFAKLCSDKSVFTSAEHMAAEFDAVGYLNSRKEQIGVKRCERIRNRTAKTQYAREKTTVEYIIRRRKALARAAETEAEISALQDRIAELRASQ